MATFINFLLPLGTFLYYQAFSLELLANYKLWDVVNNQILYDHSGNSRHGSPGWRYMYTDRGMSSYWEALVVGLNNLPNPNERFSDLAISFWLYSKAQSSDLRVFLYTDSVQYALNYGCFVSSAGMSIYATNNPNVGQQTISVISGWNLHTLRVHPDPSINTNTKIDYYVNLNQIYSFSMNFHPYLSFKNFILALRDFGAFTMIFYEVWVHRGFSQVNDLGSLISFKATCSCKYDCPTSPNVTCLSDYSALKNSQGLDCPSSCTSINLSCDKSLNCIQTTNSSCLFGFYTISTGECYFYCPENSCVCSSLSNCTCKTGYKRIIEEAAGCISIRCVAYHKEGNHYVCDEYEEGYTYDSYGSCCACSEGYLAVSTSPIVCIYLPYCLDYTKFGSYYLCSKCTVGYEIGFDSTCSECSLGYKKISVGSIGCIPSVCSEYHKDGYNFICDRAEEGYALDSYGTCCECQEGYLAISTSPIVCKHFPKCMGYVKVGDNYLCSQCEEGHQPDSNGQCLLCSENYEKIAENPLECALKIVRCSEYVRVGDALNCNTCEKGYKVSSSGLCDECAGGFINIDSSGILCINEIRNCLNYDIYSEKLGCLRCDVGFIIDSSDQCNSCDLEYIKVSDNPLECAHKMTRCYSYLFNGSEWVCDACDLGYKLDDNMKCNECADGYIPQPTELYACALKSDLENENGNSSEDTEEDEDITQAQMMRSRMIQKANKATNSIVMASTSVSGAVSMNPSVLIFYLNTIQILSYLLHLNIKLPFEIKQEQSAGKDFMKSLNILSYIRFEGKNPSEYISLVLDDSKGFFPQVIYQLLILGFIFLLNLITYCIHKFTKGKAKHLASKLLNMFKYSIYIQFIMITYIDFISSSFEKILQVNVTKPKESSMMNILDYNQAIICLVTII